MTRIMDALKLREKGLSHKEISEKMGIKKNTSIFYVAAARRKLRGDESSYKQYRRSKRTKHIRQTVKEVLYKYNLPHEWEDELTRMVVVYLADKKYKVLALHVESVALLLCRKKRFPSPRELVKATWQGRGARRITQGYMDVLQVLNGLVPATPTEYLTKYIQDSKLDPRITKQALQMANETDRLLLQGKNPRAVASAILWLSSRQLWLTGILHETEMLTQKEIANYFEVTTVSVRNIAKILNPKRYEVR